MLETSDALVASGKRNDVSLFGDGVEETNGREYFVRRHCVCVLVTDSERERLSFSKRRTFERQPLHDVEQQWGRVAGQDQAAALQSKEPAMKSERRGR